MKVSFTLNGAPRVIEARAGENVQWMLKRLGINSVRDSDNGAGFSGSDTILFDGRAVFAGLMVAAQIDGHSIETVEGLMDHGRLTILQEALLDAGAVQSAYNLPATVLVLEELLRRTPGPSEAEIRDSLSGIFNRATGYKQFFLAVDIARRRLKNPHNYVPSTPEFRTDLRVVGKNARRVDGVKLVAGMKAFVEDRVEPGSCVLKMLRSPHAHAYINEIKTDMAAAIPGVVAIITHKNCPDVLYSQAGQGFPEPSPYDRRMFSRKVRHVGDRVAAVVAEDEVAAEQAVSLIDVDYEILVPVLSIDSAMQASRAPVHGGTAKLVSGEPVGRAPNSIDPREDGIEYQFSIGADPSANLAAGVADGIGDVAAGFEAADVVIEREYTTGRVQCTPLEPHVVYTKMDGDRLIIHASTQVPWHLRRIVANVLGIRENRVRVIKERIGGGYGSKQDILLEEVCAFATFTTGRAIFYKFTRKEEFIASTTRHPFRFTVKLGAGKDGKLLAMKLTAIADTGAYGNHCLTVPMNSCSKSLPLFICDNIAFEARSYYTNLPPAGAYQGYGAPQASFALQTAAAELADALEMDFMKFLELNRVREGDTLEILKCLGEGRAGAAVKVHSCGLDRALTRGRELISWGDPRTSQGSGRQTGKGAAIIQQGSGLPGIDQACVDIKMLGDGTFMVHSGGADLGTGLDTVLAKIAAEALHCDMDAVAVLSGDTDNTPFDTGAYASSGTFFTGNAALKAARVLGEKILATAAGMLAEPVEALSLVYPSRVVGKNGELEFGQIAHHSQSGEGGGQLVGFSSFITQDSAIPYAAHFCQVAVDPRTGDFDIEKYYALHDSGTPVNPDLTLGQIYGAVLKSIGHARYEEMVFDEYGRCINSNLADYGVPMVQELPGDLQAGLIQTDDPFGPFGGKSVAEISVNGAAPVIAIAVHDAVGVWIRSWPITPEKILKALGKI